MARMVTALVLFVLAGSSRASTDEPAPGPPSGPAESGRLDVLDDDPAGDRGETQRSGHESPREAPRCDPCPTSSGGEHRDPRM